MPEFQNGYPEEKGNLKVYLGAGHLFKAPGEDRGAGEEVWKHTGLPYGTLNYVDGESVGELTTQNGSGGYMVKVSPKELESLEYPTGKVSNLLINIVNSMDVPNSVKVRGCGIAGKDVAYEKLKLPVGGQQDEDFRRQLKRYGVVDLGDLRFRPSVQGLVTLQRYGIRSFKDLADKTPNNGNKLVIASEYEHIAHYVMRRLVGLGLWRGYEVMKTTGKTESHVVNGDADAGVEVIQTGRTLRENSMCAVEKPVMNSTPHLLANEKTYEMFGPFLDELQKRLLSGVDELESDAATRYLFEDMVDDSIFTHPEEEGIGPLSNAREEGYLSRTLRGVLEYAGLGSAAPEPVLSYRKGRRIDSDASGTRRMRIIRGLRNAETGATLQADD